MLALQSYHADLVSWRQIVKQYSPAMNFYVFDKNRGMTTNAGGLKEEIALNDIQNVLEEPVK